MILHLRKSMNQIIKISAILLTVSCNPKQEIQLNRLEYKRWIGDISFDESKDSKKFVLCNDESQTYQYFNDSNGLEYDGEKISIISTFNSEYHIYKKDETGLIRIRFMVNCKGETGRFRVLGMDDNYKAKNFNLTITSELLRITKSLTGWKSKIINGRPIDYYQYLIFKLENGKIVEILP